MKKTTLTPNQIHILETNIRAAILYHATDSEYVTKKLKLIKDFLNLAAELYIIEDYKEVTKIIKKVGDAGVEEYNAVKKAIV